VISEKEQTRGCGTHGNGRLQRGESVQNGMLCGVGYCMARWSKWVAVIFGCNFEKRRILAVSELEPLEKEWRDGQFVKRPCPARLGGGRGAMPHPALRLSQLPNKIGAP